LADPALAQGSYRQILRSSTIVGGASVAQVALGLVRMKAAALLVGISGVGLIGLFNNLVLTGGTLGGLGIANAATRQIAAERSRAGDRGEAVARRAFALVTLALAVAATVLVWLLRAPIAQLALGDRNYTGAVGWLSFGVGLTIIASSQAALLAGLRRMGRIAQVYVLGSLVATIAGIVALMRFGSTAIIFFVIAFPLANLLAGAWFIAKLPRPAPGAARLGELWLQWRQLAGLGLAIMLGQLFANAAQLAARGIIAQRLGLPELGLFQAAWAISMTYLGIVLQAMSADYYPRLSGTTHESGTAARIINEQTEVALLLGGPIILAALGLAPLGLKILYSSAFRPAAELLRWQMLGDILKIASWPIGYALLAANRGRIYLLLEGIAWTVFLLATWLLLPRVGLKAPGIASLAMYLIYLPLALIAAHKTLGFRWTGGLVIHLAALLVAAVIVFRGAAYSGIAGAMAGLGFAAAFGVAAAWKLRRHIGRIGTIGQ